MGNHKKKRLSVQVEELETDSAKMLLKCYSSSEEETPENRLDISKEPGTLVWAKNFRSIYWPAFIVVLEDKPDLTEEEAAGNYINSAMVMFLEDKFRYTALPWERIIPIQEEHFEEQLELVIKLNKKENKKTSTSSASYKRSIEYLREFRNYPAGERQSKAVTEFSTQKIQRKQSITDGSKPSPDDSITPLPVLTPKVKVKQEEPVKRKQNGRYSLRDPPPPPTRSPSPPSAKEGTGGKIDSNGTNNKNSENNAASDKIVDVVEKIKKEGTRPKEGGRALKDWAAAKFHPIDKTFRFESQGSIVCSANDCGKEINNGETPVFCHDFPFHGNCVKEIEGSDNGKTHYKCDDCLRKACFLCKSTDQDCLKCSKCDLFYHVNCLRPFPQAEIQSPVGPITCPLHYCHTCIAEHSILKKVRNYKVGKGNALRCIKCPTAYHRMCLPAASLSTVMSNGFITCPKHQDFEIGKKGRRLGCFMCNKQLGTSKGKQHLLVNCSKCPLSYHMKCVVDETTFETSEEREKYRSTFECEGCFWGLYPVPGQAVWCRQARYGFWPARILYPKEASQRTVLAPHSFSIVYFGNQQTYYDGARCVRTVTLGVAAYEVLQKIKMFSDDAKLTTAYEEGTFIMGLSEDHRAAILAEPEPIYKKTEKNVYKTTTNRKSNGGKRKDRDIGHDKSRCTCSDDKSAREICSVGSGCINRDLAIECTLQTCGDENRCTNRMFSRKTPDKIVSFATYNKGWGVKTLEPFKKGDFVAEYVGEVISKELYQWRLERKFCNDPHYFLELDTNSYIDAEYVGNLSRLINHSCEPNCSTEKYMSLGKPVVGVFTKYDIPPGTELTFNYAYEMTGNSAKTFNCCCGATNCRGQVNNKLTNQMSELSPSQLRKDEEWKEYCEICSYPGDKLMCCEAPQCDKAYHADCVGLSSVPSGIWICPDHPSTKSKTPRKRKMKPQKIKTGPTTTNNDQENKKRKRSRLDKVDVVETVTDHRENKTPLVPRDQETN